MQPQNDVTTKHDPVFHDLLISMQDELDDLLEKHPVIFRTGGRSEDLTDNHEDPLMRVFLDNVPAEDRQYHTCNCCRQFLARFGSAVVVDDRGIKRSLLWNPQTVPDYYKHAVTALNAEVAAAPIVGTLRSKHASLGTLQAGGWTHLNVTLPASHLLKSRDPAERQEATDTHNHMTLATALTTMNAEHLKTALHLLESGALGRAEKVTGQAAWLHQLKTQLGSLGGKASRNLLWLASATAPQGWCQPRSNMIGSLLEDIAAGLSVENIRKRFNSKMDPLQYQRPQVAATAGNIQQAEKLIQDLGLERALERRYATLDDVQAFWLPKPAQAEDKGGSGVFGHLVPKGQEAREQLVPTVDCYGWAEFREQFLPNVIKLELLTDTLGYGAFTTAVHADAPPLLKWDREDLRNPVSSYTYRGATAPRHWGLESGVWVPVLAICDRPETWSGDRTNHDSSVTLMLRGAEDRRAGAVGLALFPEDMRGELHPIRATIESFSKAGTMQRPEGQLACGLMLSRLGMRGHVIRLRATTETGTTVYILHHW